MAAARRGVRRGPDLGAMATDCRELKRRKNAVEIGQSTAADQGGCPGRAQFDALSLAEEEALTMVLYSRAGSTLARASKILSEPQTWWTLVITARPPAFSTQAAIASESVATTAGPTSTPRSR